jgi:5-methyltetrahydrofolate--homocysteine methyltransferase
MDPIRHRLEDRAFLLLDGGMGTLLMAAGLPAGQAPEGWNLDHPERVEAVHRGYLRAGSDLILTNSFGGSSFRLKGHGLEDRVVEVNQAAAVIARQAAEGVGREVLVAGSMGPSGEMMDPLGLLTAEAAREGFALQAEGLARGGVDLLWIETMGDLREAEAAIQGARAVTDLPLVATLSFDTGERTVMGATPEEAVVHLLRLGVVAVGANCGNGIRETEQVIRRMAAMDPGIPIVSKSNAGRPVWEEGALVYDGTAEVMADHARRVRALGAQLIGGCCGTSPGHLEAMGASLKRGV